MMVGWPRLRLHSCHAVQVLNSIDDKLGVTVPFVSPVSCYITVASGDPCPKCTFS